MFQSYVGLEIHIQLLTASKVFCGCRASFGDEPNTNVCPVCMGYPGVLPTLNEEAIQKAYLVARALNCELSGSTVFARKNYFYPDLPKNYQISQFDAPLGRNGFLDVAFHKSKKRVRIREVHLEEDAGKMIHVGDMSLLDFNRAGTPLLEIVTAPDLEIGEEAELFLQEFRRLVRYLGVCDGNMEEGSLRCDANVSVNEQGAGLGRKVEIKNMNSFRFVRKALTFEIERHEEILERGGTVLQETRLWNENRDVTESMRVKEEANDYRYFPEPDLPPFKTAAEFLKAIDSALVELPHVRRARMIADYGIVEPVADFLVEEKERADFYESTVALGADPVAAASWMGSDVKRILNRRAQEGKATDLVQTPLTPARFAELLKLLADGRIHGKIAKQVLDSIFESGREPSEIIRENGWEQITDRTAIQGFVDEAIASHPQVAASVRAGDQKPMGFLVGEVMKRTSGRVEPQLLQAVLAARLRPSRLVVIAAGGAMTARRQGNRLVAGTPEDVATLVGRVAAASVDELGEISSGVTIEEVAANRRFSEEMGPDDWGALISRVDTLVSRVSPRAVVITHGTDTLPYTAAIFHWFFASCPCPIVLTASIDPEQDADRNFMEALRVASRSTGGVHVVTAGRALLPINLKFERVAADGFTNWNVDGELRPAGLRRMDEPIPGEADLVDRLSSAVNEMHVVRVYPGLRNESLIELMESGTRCLILELYDTGTASVRDTPYSIRKALEAAREHGVAVYCTSQQQGTVDFSSYPTSHELWKDGAVPMGRLTTESAYMRYIAARVLTGSEQEARELMENFDA